MLCVFVHSLLKFVCGEKSFISVESLDKLLKLVDHLSWYWAVAHRILQLSITWENCCTISGAERIASEAKNNHWVRDGIFSAKCKLISNNFSTSFQISNKRRRGKKDKIMFISKETAFPEKFVAVHGAGSWNKLNFSVSVRLCNVKCQPCE